MTPGDASLDTSVPLPPGDASSDGTSPPPMDIPPSDQITPPPTDVPAPPPDVSAVGQCARSNAADLLFVIDNSNSMSQSQATFTQNLGALLDELTGGDTATAVRDLHVGVISTDLGTPGSVVPSCANSDSGDNGLLNPIRNGLAIRTHQPWTTAPMGRRPARCTMDMNQYTNFLSFTSSTNPTDLRDDFVCNAYLSLGGCGLEQQLESAYRALVVHDARAVPGNMSPNAGFVRDESVLGLFVLTDEEDGSVRDTRYAETGFPVRDAIAVYDSTSPEWSSNDLNLRFYMYVPGSAQDPTWALDRYLDPTRPNRGFTSLKAGRPGLVVFGAVAGVPINLPEASPGRVDWNALLGRSADGSDALTAMSAEGPVSMRQRNMDPMCSTRVVPSCRREGSTYNPLVCDANQQYFAWPSRRVAQVARRFDETYGNAVLGSVCRNDYSATLRAFAAKVRARICR